MDVGADALGPTGRALSVLQLIQGRPGIGAAELAGRMGVTERAIRRSVDALRRAGIAIDSTPGRHGGYRTCRGLSPTPVVFSASEILTLSMAVLETPRAGRDPSLRALLSRLLDTLPSNVARPAQLVHATVRSSPTGGGERPDAHLLGELVTAVAEQRPVQLGYRAAGRRESTTIVDAWAVVVRRGLWYLLAHSHAADQLRTYRVDRVQSAMVTEDRFELPAEFDPVELLEERLGQGWEYPTSVLFHEPVEQVRHFVGPVMGRLSAVDERSCRLTGTTSDPLMYAQEWLAATGLEFTVEQGPELRAACAELSRRFARSIADPAPGHAIG